MWTINAREISTICPLDVKVMCGAFSLYFLLLRIIEIERKTTFVFDYVVLVLGSIALLTSCVLYLSKLITQNFTRIKNLCDVLINRNLQAEEI